MGIYIYLSNSCLLLGYSFQWIKQCSKAQLKFKEMKETLEFVWLKLTWTGREGIKTMLLSMALSWLPGERCRNQILLFLNAVSPVSHHIHSQQCQRVLWWLWCGWGGSWTKGRCPNSAEQRSFLAKIFLHGETDPESFNQLWFSKQFLSWTSQAVGGALHFLYCDFE